MRKNGEVILGECECCTRHTEPVQLFAGSHGMMMCEVCFKGEPKTDTSNTVVIQSRQIDDTIELSQDIMNAGTVPFIEIMAAINQDDSIPTDKKEYAIIAEVAARIDKYSGVIFEQKTELQKNENLRRALQVNLQELVSKTRNKEIESKYKNYAVNYTPAVTKGKKPSSKSPASTSQSSKYTSKVKAEVADACVKYGVDAVSVRMTMLQKNMSADAAAKHVLSFTSKS